jgi:hypothetical protein
VETTESSNRRSHRIKKPNIVTNMPVLDDVAKYTKMYFYATCSLKLGVILVEKKVSGLDTRDIERTLQRLMDRKH